MAESTTTKLTSEQRKTFAILDGLGRIKVLAIGVNDYLKASGFGSLKKCENDAFQVVSAFIEVQQLHADQKHLVLMTSKTPERLPYRGLILNELHNLASKATENERILFYFSGHGHRIEGIDDHFLVPQDAYSESSQDAMISMKKVLEILGASPAKQKIVIVDACFSGPVEIGKKLHSATYSDKFLANYLKQVKGVAVISSSAADQSSFEQSPNPKLGLFTFHLVQGLRGDQAALDKQILTIPSLFDFVSARVKRDCLSYRVQQTPSLKTAATGTMVMADFRRALVAPVNLKEYPFDALVFRDTHGEKTKCILTEWSNRSLSPEQLQFAANTDEAMGAYVSKDFAKWRPLLRKEFGFTPSEIDQNGGGLLFPGGSLNYLYKAASKDSGKILRKLRLDVDWFENGARLLAILRVFNFTPDALKLELELSLSLKPMEQVAGLEANGWEIDSEDEDKVVAAKGDVTVTVRPRKLIFEGVQLPKLLASGSITNEDQKVFQQTVQLLAPSNNRPSE